MLFCSDNARPQHLRWGLVTRLTALLLLLAFMTPAPLLAEALHAGKPARGLQIIVGGMVHVHDHHHDCRHAENALAQRQGPLKQRKTPDSAPDVVADTRPPAPPAGAALGSMIPAQQWAEPASPQPVYLLTARLRL